MSRLRLAYYASLVLLVALLALVLHGALVPATSPASEAQRAQLVELPDRWAITQTVFNREQEPLSYSIVVFVGGNKVTEDAVSLKTGGAWVYTHHVYPEQLGSGQVTLSVYEKGREDPVDTTTYFLTATRLIGPEKSISGPSRG